MKVGLILKPGDRGTKKEAALYGDKLLCVRYRYDETRKIRAKTVELIVEQIPWTGLNTPVFLKVHWDEKEIQGQIKNAGGKWDKTRKVWILEYKKAEALGLKSRIQKNIE
jgi:hypothetical protein